LILIGVAPATMALTSKSKAEACCFPPGHFQKRSMCVRVSGSEVPARKARNSSVARESKFHIEQQATACCFSLLYQEVRASQNCE
jgi:hypothetical protein